MQPRFVDESNKKTVGETVVELWSVGWLVVEGPKKIGQNEWFQDVG